MEFYTAEQVASTLVDDSDFEAESDSDIEEDPDFPLPTLNSDDEEEDALSMTTSPTRGSSVLT